MIDRAYDQFSEFSQPLHASLGHSAVTGTQRLPRPPIVQWSTISEVAREFSVTLRALRFYEAKGLITPLRQGNQRLYSPTDRARISLILSAKELGFTLSEISGLLEEGGGSNLAINPELLLRQIAFMEKQFKTIESALAALRMRYYTMTEAA